MIINRLKTTIFLFIVIIPVYLTSAEVDLNGFLSHSVEIKLPPGTNGLAPKLSLDYNSGAGNGIVGQGWSLNGLPAITRDTTNGIRYDGKDSYIGSSGRLKVQSDGSYHYEYENYSKVQKSGTAGDGPAYWVETKPDGTKYYYGNYGDINTASVTAIGKNGSIRVWALSKVVDVHGNYYTVDYMQEDGEYYPKRIIYTQGNGISKLRVVDFEYGSRGDFWTQYIYSSAVTTKLRLEKIIVNIDVPEFLGWRLTFFGRKVREYSIAYEGGLSGVDVSRVVKIYEFGLNNQITDRSHFIWSPAQESDNGKYGLVTYRPWGGYSTGSGVWQSGDVNGDGKTDLIHMVGDYANTWLSQGDGKYVLVTYRPWGGYSTGSGVWRSGDVNGDGKTDLIHMVSDYANTWLSQGDGKYVLVTYRPWGGYSTGSGVWQSGDVNGDGKADLIHMVGDYANTWLSQGDGKYVLVTYRPWGGYSTGSGVWRSGDVNGDGKTDLIHMVGDYANTWLSQGDGKYVLVTYRPWGGYSTGSGVWQSGDVNGDGKADLIHMVSDYANTWLSQGDGKYVLVTYRPWGGYSTGSGVWQSGDVNGDGKTDLIHMVGDYANTWLPKSGNSLITCIKSDTGLTIDIEFEDVINTVKFPDAIKQIESVYPLIANASPRELVTSIKVNDGRSSSYLKEYSYYNGKFHTGFPEERQNLYFEKIIETDTSTGIKTTTYYDQRPWYAGSPVSVITTAGNRTLKIEDFTYDTTTGTGFANTHAVRLMDTISTTYESGVPAVTNSKTLSYDTRGNTTKIIDTAGSSSITTLITYDTDPVILNRPLEVTKTSGGKIIDSKKYMYSNHKISSMSAYLNTSGGYVATIYGTDDCGNITSIKDPAGHTTSIEYDSDYSTFIAEVTNPLGHTVSMEYDAATGNPISKTDQNGNTTENEYDGAGRLVSVTNADGDIVQEIDYHDELRGNANSQYIETIVHNDSAAGYTWSRSYYDGLGREYKKVSSAGTIDSTPVLQVVDTFYDTAGRVSSRTLPYIENKQDILKIYYSYDDAGKVIEERRPDNVTISTSYAAVSGGIQVTKSDPKGNVSTALYDSRGRLVKKTEPEGAQVLYSYDEAGRLVRTVDAGNHVTLITYDSLGRKTSITDPNTGEITYSYDLTGNLVSKTDALGNAVSYTYDEISRLTKTDYPDDTPDVVYNYDESSSANGKGRVTSVENGVSSTKYAYDSNGNVNYLRQTVENIDFIFTMEHDTQNRMTALTYPDGTRTERDYHETGYLKAVRQGTGAYVQYALKLDGNGTFKNSVRRVTGNGVDTSISYNPANMRPMAVESRDKNNTLLEQNEYTYDKTGNITAINDKFDTAKSQTFEYDRLNRLTKGKGIYGEQNFSYDPAGNLLKNSHGDLTYGDSLHPYAVTADGEGNSYTYDANGQMLTGRNREMVYDAAGRLVSLKKAGTVIQKNKYDHTGHRVLQEKKDGTLIYNINGLYEIVKTASRPDYHTKYIYGMEGDLAAQVTTPETALVAANFGNGFIFDKGYGSNPLTSLIAKGYIKADKFISKGKNILKLQYAMVIMLLAAITTVMLKSGITRRIKQLKRSTQPVWSSAVSLMLVISIIVSFSLTGCDDIIAGITPTLGGGGSSSSVTTDTEGLPTLGTYYFHPDHVGSVGYLTDSEGAVVTRMSYTPYGEKVKSASTGPDIFHQKYTGQIDDGEESELMYYNARYYDPKIGRFISADSIIPGAGFSQSFNRYMYVAGNPVNYNDPSGHKWGSGFFHKVVDVVSNTGNAIKNLGSDIKNKWDKTLGSKDWRNGKKDDAKNYFQEKGNDIANYWAENQWLRVFTYTVIIVACVLLTILFPPAIGVTWGLVGVLGGALLGSLYFGTNGEIVTFFMNAYDGGADWSDFKNVFKDWDWERALMGAAIGALVGTGVSYAFSSVYKFFTSGVGTDYGIIRGVGSKGAGPGFNGLLGLQFEAPMAGQMFLGLYLGAVIIGITELSN